MRYSAIDKGRETNSGKKTDGHTEVHPDDSPLGEPGAGKLYAGIYWRRASRGARLPTKAARPVLCRGTPRKGRIYSPGSTHLWGVGSFRK